MKEQDTKKAKGTKPRAKAKPRKPSVARTFLDEAKIKAFDKEKSDREALEAVLKNYGVRDVGQEASGRKRGINKGGPMKELDTKKAEGTKPRAKAKPRKPSVAKTSLDEAKIKAFDKEKSDREALEAVLKNYGVRDVT